MSSVGRPVPWSNWREWRQVHVWLTSNDAQNVQHGLDKVAAWRCRGKLPLGVDSYACLLGTQLRDPCGLLSLDAAKQEDDVMLRMQYAMAIVRLVNGIADSGQKGRTANSVAAITAAAGLPRALVDLRHEATHNELPSLPVLRLAAIQATAWLRETYWDPQERCLQDAQRRCAELLKAIVDCQLAICRSTNLHIQVVDSAAQVQLQAHLAELKALIPPAAAALIVRPLLQSSVIRPPPLRQEASTTLEGSPKTSLPRSLPPGGLQGCSDADHDCVDSVPSQQALLQDQTWQALMQRLHREWPALPGLCLREAIDTLLRGDASYGHCYAWASGLLLTSARAHGVHSSSAANTAQSGNRRLLSQTFSWHPQLRQLSELLKHCLDATASLSGAAAQRGEAMSKPHLDAMDVIVLLSSNLDTALEPMPGGCESASYERAARSPATAGGHSELLPPNNDRWHVVHDWVPCAIGLMPSTHDPNGASSLPVVSIEAAGHEEIGSGETMHSGSLGSDASSPAATHESKGLLRDYCILPTRMPYEAAENRSHSQHGNVTLW